MGTIAENIKQKGIIGIVLTDKYGNVQFKKTFENFVSSGDKVNLLGNSVSKADQIPTGTQYGMLLTDPMYQDFGDISGNTDRVTYDATDTLETCFALNLSDALVMTSATKFLDLYETDGSLGSKITAFANTKRSVADAKEGIIDFCDGTAMLDMLSATEVYKWDLTQGNGTFNWIAKAPGVVNQLYRGFVNYKGICKVNLFDSGTSLSNKYIMPGAGAITSNYEILLEYTTGTGTRWKYNLQTGETSLATGVASTMTMRNDTVHQVVIGSYLYSLDASGIMATINTTTGAEVNAVSVGLTGSMDYKRKSLNKVGFFVDSIGDLYVSRMYYSSTQPSVTSFAVLRKVTLGTGALGSEIYMTNYAGLGGLPSSWNKNWISIMSDSTHTRYYVSEASKGCIICTDLSNVVGTRIGSLDIDNRRAPYYNADMGYKFMRVGTGYQYPKPYMYNGASLVNVPYHNVGTFVSADDFSNYISAYKLDTPVTKTNEQVMYIAYGYKFI